MSITHSPMSRSAFPDADASGHPGSYSPIRSVPDVEARESAEDLARVLGWFSIGLGVAALAAPRDLARLIGARGDRFDRAVLRLVGLQELVVGAGILRTRRPTGWMWARVAGDLAHLSMLGGSMASGVRHPDRVAATTAAIAGIAAVDTYNAVQLSRRPTVIPGTIADEGGPIQMHETITIGRTAEELYRFWRDFENLPRIMGHLESIHVPSPGKSHWTTRGPLGTSVEWDAEIIEDRPNELIAWRSVGGRVHTAGSVRFVPAPGGRGTEVHVSMRYDPPGGAVGSWFAGLFGEAPEHQIHDALRHFKQVMETGEVVLSEGGLDGSRLAQRPGQPPESIPRW